MIVISTDKERLDIHMIHEFLTKSYWAKGRSIEQVKSSIEHCLCFGVYSENKQIGFARIATDYTVFAYLMDVFILPEYRGNGYAKELMLAIHNEPKLKPCRTWMLKTSDAHKLYNQFGYTELKHPEKVMERLLK
ncbi:GNAT family N-acetyltransferase [uncultured Psychroserpens sp.]|uniref:GNAT family N-acetyltransferase n=1 Tax=uncultured Psychroserpens sp. TaxID=255436 RepID=UPI0026034BD3|nr:GNAT family N-acetyltransferase [uncultured Psychroserpens sp.]